MQPTIKTPLRYAQWLIFALALSITLLAHTQIRSAQTCESSNGTITRSSFRSTPAETTFYYSVYTPPCYAESTVSYPVVYLMHGSNDDDGQWGRLGIGQALDTGIANGTLP